MHDTTIARTIESTKQVRINFPSLGGLKSFLLTAYEDRIEAHNSTIVNNQASHSACNVWEGNSNVSPAANHNYGDILYTTTSPPEVWLLSAIFMFGMYYLMYHNISLKVSNKQIAYFCAFMIVTMSFPFVSYMFTDQSWTAMKFSGVEKAMIDKRHVITMFTWVGAAMVQTISYAFGHQKVHKRVGRWTHYYLLPLLFVELCCNAFFVFVPLKERQLAHILTGTPMDQVTSWQVFLFSLPYEVALCVPIVMAVFSVLSHKALHQCNDNSQKRNIQMHIFWMAQFIIASLEAGILRWQVQYVMTKSDCHHLSYKDEPVLVLIQMIACDWAILWWACIPILLYCTLPKETRQDDWTVKVTAYGFMVYGVSSPIFAYMLNAPAGIQCTRS